MTTTAVADRVSPFDVIGTANKPGGDSATCLAGAGLDFDVETVDLNSLVKDHNTEVPPEKYYVTRRKDNGAMLGVVEGRFRVFQNADLFAIADAMVEDDGAQITRACCIDDGTRCFMNLTWPQELDINVVGDIVGRRAILQNAHNGKYAALIRLMPMRLACINGMVIPVPVFSFEFRIKHTDSGEERLKEAQRIMASASRYFETFGRVADRMAHTTVTAAHAKLILKAMPELRKTTDAAEKKRGEIVSLFDGGQANATHEAVKRTAWGLLNAVVEFADHKGKIRKTKGNNESDQRFKSAFEGTGARLKVSIYDALLKDKSLGLGDFDKSLRAELESQRN